MGMARLLGTGATRRPIRPIGIGRSIHSALNRAPPARTGLNRPRGFEEEPGASTRGLTAAGPVSLDTAPFVDILKEHPRFLPLVEPLFLVRPFMIPVDRRPSWVGGLASLLLAITLAAPGCESLRGLLDTAEKPSVRVTGVRFQDLSLESLKLVFDTEVTNPYQVPLPLVNLDYSLSSAGKEFLAGKAPVQGSIPPKGSQVVPLPAALSFAPVLKVLEGVAPGSVVPYEAGLKLSVDAPAVGVLTLPLSHSGSLPIPAIPEVHLAQVEWKSLSVDSASAVIHLTVKNTNQFPVDLQKLAFGLSLADAKVGEVGFGEPTKFEAGGQATLRIPVSLSLKGLGLGAFNLLKGEGTGYRIEGDMGLGTPFGPLSMPLVRSGTTKLTR
jgi:LEA14-like dessication related protein